MLGRNLRYMNEQSGFCLKFSLCMYVFRYGVHFVCSGYEIFASLGSTLGWNAVSNRSSNLSSRMLLAIAQISMSTELRLSPEIPFPFQSVCQAEELGGFCDGSESCIDPVVQGIL